MAGVDAAIEIASQEIIETATPVICYENVIGGMISNAVIPITRNRISSMSYSTYASSSRCARHGVFNAFSDEMREVLRVHILFFRNIEH